MINALRSWMISIVVVSMLISVIQAMTPDGNLRKIVSILSGLVLLLTMLQPLIHRNIDVQISDKEDIQQEIRQRTEKLQKEQAQESGKLIEDKTAAYIAKEAKRMGISCTVHVKTAVGKDGIPRPVSAALSCPPSAQLSEYMERELGIAKGGQTWNEQSG